MSTSAKTRLTVEQYLKKFEGSEGRLELVDGAVVKLAAETARHVRAKTRAYKALEKAVRNSKRDCEVFADGMAVKIDKWTAREPDVSVQCGKPVDEDSLIVDQPVIVVEVVSPSSEFRDVYRKLIEYFSVPSIQHYLIVDELKKVVLHNKRTGRDSYVSKIMGKGTVDLDPPGLRVTVSELLKVA
jgi:Uma2 family endonuclease